ncbi:plastocyanin/azurin family copper-binding protein [Haloferax sp. YSSS75]|uniref:cupredoxin domain-containing protein n=1 Tax=Haloferax sp. YSSS75 TaxID=3388564 RepID=UPI00398CCEF1
MTITPAAGEASDEQQWFPIARRNLLRAAGASAALLGMGVGTTVAQSDEDEDGDGYGDDGESPQDDGTSDDGPQAEDLDPIFGYASAELNPCAGDSSEECFEAFDESVRPSHEVELHIDLPEELFAFFAPGILTQAEVDEINAAVADGVVEPEELSNPDSEVTVTLPAGEGTAEPSDGEQTDGEQTDGEQTDGEQTNGEQTDGEQTNGEQTDGEQTLTLTILEIAELLAETTAFHYEPTGISVEPGDVVLYSAETPDHGVAAYHERHGRQNRVPEGVGPISAPLVPVGGYWLYKFETPGVYDFYCPPHQIFGMVSRVVVTDGDVPELSIEETGRPPEEMNVFPLFLQGLDPNLPSSAAVFDTDALTPENIVDEGSVSWETVVEEYRSGGGEA